MDAKYKSVVPRFRWLPQLFYVNTLLHAVLVIVAAAVFLLHSSGAYSAETSDPLEPVNRATLRLNQAVDTVLFKPLAQTYQRYTPGVVKSGVRNFFGNLGNLASAANNVLQLRLDRAATDVSRFVINSTAGLGGIIEVAEPVLGLQSSRQDFGMTLAAWGIGPGPYVMLPLLGPSTVRDAFGLGFDNALNPVQRSGEASLRDPLLTTQAVDRRAAFLPFDELLFGDEYLFIRELYLQNRHYKTHGESLDVAFETFQ